MWSYNSLRCRVFSPSHNPLKLAISKFHGINSSQISACWINSIGTNEIKHTNVHRHLQNVSYSKWMRSKQVYASFPSLVHGNETKNNIDLQSQFINDFTLIINSRESLSGQFYFKPFHINKRFLHTSCTNDQKKKRSAREVSLYDDEDVFNLNEEEVKDVISKRYQPNNDSDEKSSGKQSIYFEEDAGFQHDRENVRHRRKSSSLLSKRPDYTMEKESNSASHPIEADKEVHVEDSTGFAKEMSDLSANDAEKITKLFPTPKVTLNNLQVMLGEKFYEETSKPIKTKGKTTRQTPWLSTYRLTWPETIQFHSQAHTKSIASNKAALKVLHYLYSKNNITAEGQMVHSKEKIDQLRKDLNPPLLLTITPEELTKINDIVNKFEEFIEPLLENAKHKLLKERQSSIQNIPIDLTTSEVNEEMEEEDGGLQNETGARNVHSLNSIHPDSGFMDPIFSMAPQDKDPAKMKRRNTQLQYKFENARPETHLPITPFRQELVETIAANRAMVVRGAPGCGKSTRVPSYILDSFSERGEGANCSILISQPRRVAALSLAARVAHERGERVGDVCGHQVRLSTVFPEPPGGALLYCTAGALLRRFAASPELPGCSHLVLDEAHERSADSDAVMALSKRAMKLNPNLKVIVMSATIDTKLFSRYFDNCPIMDIPGFTYPVESHYLDEFTSGNWLSLDKTWEANKREDGKAFVDANDVAEVIRWVDKTKPEGAILCFLPGWGEIRKVKDQLEYQLGNSRAHFILPVHSRLSNQDQQKIFSAPPPGARKIILATNIAETSITIDDVVYVIDTGVHREQRLMDAKGISSLDSDWVSQANVAQRKGRAGRVKPGHCFHMYTQEKMHSFIENPTPEILRVPLEKTVLDCKTYSEKEKALDFLKQFPQPPRAEAIELAVNDLIDLGALDKFENLTSLGRRIASFTTHPKLSKALVHSTIFKVVSPVVDISTILSNNTDVFTCLVNQRDEVRRTKRKYHPTSDHQALYWLNDHYERIKREEGFRSANDFCRQYYLRRERMNSIGDLRKICLEHLQQCRMLSKILDYDNIASMRENKYASVDELVKGVLLSGLNTVIQTRFNVKSKGKLEKVKDVFTDRGQRAFMATDSVNHQAQKLIPDGVYLHCGAVHSEERRGVLVRDTSLLSPITLFMFCSKIKKVYQNEEKVVFEINNRRIMMQCTPTEADALVQLRDITWSIVEYYIDNRGFRQHDKMDAYRKLLDEENYSNAKDKKENDDFYIIEHFRESLIKVLAKMLNDSEKIIDYSTPKMSKYSKYD